MKDILNLAGLAQKRAQELLPKAGINKQREITRLIFEICKRDNANPENILQQQKITNFEQAKKLLLALRYPVSYNKAQPNAFYLPKLDLSALPDAKIRQTDFYPKNIFIEKEVLNSALAQRALNKFPAAKLTVLEKKTR